jgi:hypothetical protein
MSSETARRVHDKVAQIARMLGIKGNAPFLLVIQNGNASELRDEMFFKGTIAERMSHITNALRSVGDEEQSIGCPVCGGHLH